MTYSAAFTHFKMRVKSHMACFFLEWKRDEPIDWQALGVIIVGAILVLPLTLRLPFLGHDWFLLFTQIGDLPADSIYLSVEYPPWTDDVLSPLLVGGDWLGFALLNGLLFMTVAVATTREARNQSRISALGAAGMALLTAPVLILLWQGNVAGLVLLGVLGLPLTLPYALLQPNLCVWAILARRKWVLWTLVFLLISFLLWGFWPDDVAGTVTRRSGHPVAMGWQVLGIHMLLIGLVMLWSSNADPLRLMAAGAFVSPYVMGVHLVLLLPALGRVRGWRRVMLWILAWMAILPPMFVDHWSKYAAMLFPFAVWWLLRPQKN